MNVIFLDIDGVLNNQFTKAKTPLGFTGIGNAQLDRLSRIIRQTNCRIVLSSTWKREWDKNPDKRSEDGRYLSRKFQQKGLFIFDKIEDCLDGSFYRGAAILAYLEKHPEIEDYIVLDDFAFDFEDYDEIKEHWIQTEESIGLTEEHVEQICFYFYKSKELIEKE